VSLRSLGRWLYHAITSSDKRPYIESSLEELEVLADESSSASEAFRLLGIFDELSYRITSPERRDRLKTRIANQLLRMEGIRLPISSDREKVSEIRAQLLSRYAEKADTERNAKEAAAEKARLAAEAEAKRQAEQEEQARQAAEAERLRLEQERLAAEAEAKRQAEQDEQARQAAEAEADRRAQEGEQAHQAAEAERLRLEQASGIAEEAHSTAVVENATTAEAPAPEDAITEPYPYTDTDPSNKTENNLEDKQGQNASIIEAARRRSNLLGEKDDEDAEPENQTEAEHGGEDESEPVEAEIYADSSTLDIQGRPSDLSRRSLEDRTSKIDRVWKRRLERDLRRMEARERNAPKKDHQQELETPRYDNRNEPSRPERLEAASTTEEDKENYDIEAEDLKNEEDDSEAGTDSVAIGSYQLNPDWRRWSEEEWNYNLLRYCFVDNANNGDSHGIPSSEEDLRYVVSDDQAPSVEIAKALTTAILSRASRYGKRPALLCKQRVERWNPLGNTEPPFVAFLWSTCMISQGYPNPNADGEFHARYERVYGFQEKTSCQALIPAWEMLAQWLERDDVFPSESHRKLKLPSTIDPNKKNISHSWKLSFPRRSDRSVLSVALEDLLDQGISLENITADIVRYIRDSGGFSPEFTKLLGEQLKYVETGLALEEWFENLIQREIQCLIEIDSNERTRNSERRAYTSDQLTLRVDVDDPGSVYLVLPKQKLEEPVFKDNSVKYCIIDPAGEEFLADTKRGCLVIEEEVRDHVESIQDEWIWRLRIGSLSGTTVKKWRCPGVTNDVPVLCFCPITGQRLSAFHLSTVGQEALVFLPKTFSLTATEDIEIVECYKWPSINGFHGFHLEKSVASTTLWFTSSNECQSELSIPWSSTSSEKPCLTGQLIRARKLTYATAPILWLPPSKQSTTVELSIRDLQTKQIASEETIIINPSDQWFKHELPLSLPKTGRFAVRTSLARKSPEMPLKWRENFFLAGPAQIDDRCPQDMAIEHQLFDSSRTLSLADFIPHYFDAQERFWLSDWILKGLWPFEPVMIQLSGAGESHKASAVASPDGAIRISTAEFRNALPDRVNSFRLSVQPHGMRSPIRISLFGSQDDWLQEDEKESNAGVKAPPPTPNRRFTCMVILSSLNYSGPISQSESSSKNTKNVKMFVDKMTRERDAAHIFSDDIEIGHADTNVWIIISRNELREEVKRLVNSVQEEVPFRITLGSYKRHGI